MDTVVLCRNIFGNNFSLLGCASYFKVQNLLLRTKFRKSHYSSLSTWGSLVPSKYHQSSLDQLEFSTQFKANKRTSLYKKEEILTWRRWRKYCVFTSFWWSPIAFCVNNKLTKILLIPRKFVIFLASFPIRQKVSRQTDKWHPSGLQNAKRVAEIQ